MDDLPVIHLCLFGCGLVVNSAPTRQSGLVPHMLLSHKIVSGSLSGPSSKSGWLKNRFHQISALPACERASSSASVVDVVCNCCLAGGLRINWTTKKFKNPSWRRHKRLQKFVLSLCQNIQLPDVWYHVNSKSNGLLLRGVQED